ncbi:uncharacterized protein LOC109726442 [Ananas comosus]|uniref:Uncharacterized protein LOC109726442 n=1 Tax=Ananas comosus TaxID=4615 RepID=A0A6P5GUV3_ANACO|nr:uncharacterized protein LOC109726442 [Ananas comosus]
MRFPGILLALLIISLAWGYHAILRPPPPTLCGSQNGPPVRSPRIRLRDGRYLAYKEAGVPKEKAKFKLIVVHGLDATKDILIPASQKLVEDLGIYFLQFDRPGYGESDPNPKRSVRSDAMDIEELADQLEIGSKFYVMGVSMGGHPVWGCLNYIPHRLAGAALVVPVINYWWPSFPTELAKEGFGKILAQEQRALWVAHHIPFLFHWWMTQKWFPASASATMHPDIFSKQDKEIFQKIMAMPMLTTENKARQQGEYESIHRDYLIAFGTWEFDPMNITNPFPNNEGSVHLWQGREDRMIPAELQRYISKKLPWIRYHENSKGGHLFMLIEEWTDKILKALFLGEEPSDA